MKEARYEAGDGQDSKKDLPTNRPIDISQSVRPSDDLYKAEESLDSPPLTCPAQPRSDLFAPSNADTTYFETPVQSLADRHFWQHRIDGLRAEEETIGADTTRMTSPKIDIAEELPSPIHLDDEIALQRLADDGNPIHQDREIPECGDLAKTPCFATSGTGARP